MRLVVDVKYGEAAETPGALTSLTSCISPFSSKAEHHVGEPVAFEDASLDQAHRFFRVHGRDGDVAKRDEAAVADRAIDRNLAGDLPDLGEVGDDDGLHFLREGGAGGREHE